MANRYCSVKFKSGEELDRALEAAMGSCEAAETAERAATTAAEAARAAEDAASEVRDGFRQLQDEVSALGEEVADLRDNGGASSWNELSDKPFGENEDGTIKYLDNKYLSILDSGEVDVFPRRDGIYRNVGPVTDGGPNVYVLQYQTSSPPALVVDKTYEVHWDGKTYTCTAEQLGDGIGLGNAAISGYGEASDYPFLIYVVAEEHYNGTETVYLYQTYFSTYLDRYDGTGGEGYHVVRVYYAVSELKEEWLPGTVGMTPTAVDLSKFETEGKIVETYADKTRITYTVTVDADGNPTKITDSNGNVTELTW